MIVVSDSSALIYLSVLADLDLLRSLFGEVLIPPAVWTEVVDQGDGFPVQDAVLRAAGNWLRVVPLSSSGAPLLAIGGKLHQGEIEVIRLGQQIGAETLLIDDRKAVVQARRMGFRVVPTIAIYIEAKRRGFLPHVKAKIGELQAAGFRLSATDYQAILAAVGEA